MPLGFESTSHGSIAFGFFNIESDMLLLDPLFFFADDFCTAVEQAGEHGRAEIDGYRIDARDKIGDLHGAIAGRVFTGFIGSTYRVWPFPESPDDFKQNPDGFQTQDQVRALIGEFGQSETLPLVHDQAGEEVGIAEYKFSWPQFADLIAYVDRGGHPRWKDERRPDYVTRMMRALGTQV